MTFPRRLTPSDKERATIVQQRMTPGGALGVGSRHVRSGNDRSAGQAAGGVSGGVLAAIEFADFSTPTIGPSGWWEFSQWEPNEGDNTFGDWSDYIDIGAGGVTLLVNQAAVYQVAGGVHVADGLLTAGDALTVAWDAGPGHQDMAVGQYIRTAADDASGLHRAFTTAWVGASAPALFYENQIFRLQATCSRSTACDYASIFVAIWG